MTDGLKYIPDSLREKDLSFVIGLMIFAVGTLIICLSLWDAPTPAGWRIETTLLIPIIQLQTKFT
jgi:hypothetical protein